MAYRITIYDVVNEFVVKDGDEAYSIVEYEERVNNRICRVEEVPDDELSEEGEKNG